MCAQLCFPSPPGYGDTSGCQPTAGTGQSRALRCSPSLQGSPTSALEDKNPKQTVLQTELQTALGSARVTHAPGGSIDLSIPKHRGGQKSQIFTAGTNGAVGSSPLTPPPIPVMSSQRGVKWQMGSQADSCGHSQGWQRDVICHQKGKSGGPSGRQQNPSPKSAPVCCAPWGDGEHPDSRQTSRIETDQLLFCSYCFALPSPKSNWQR